MLVEEDLQTDAVRRGGRLALALGVASLVLLGSAFLWAHHWGPLADSIVGAWSVSWIGGLVVAGWALKRHPFGRPALVGLGLAMVSVLVLGAAGIAMANGVDPASLCGGG
jgi:hypothetical protein